MPYMIKTAIRGARLKKKIFLKPAYTIKGPNGEVISIIKGNWGGSEYKF